MPSTAQRASETDEKKSRGLGSYVLWAFVAVMVYVLSSGPVYMPVYTSHSASTWRADKFYRPVSWAYFHTPLHKPIGLYWHFWRPDTFDRSGERKF
jgi:hypothetical protein